MFVNVEQRAQTVSREVATGMRTAEMFLHQISLCSFFGTVKRLDLDLDLHSVLCCSEALLTRPEIEKTKVHNVSADAVSLEHYK